MAEYRQNTHLPKPFADTEMVESALVGWAQGVETLETGYADEAIKNYHWALNCRNTLQTAMTAATFKLRTKISARLPELDRRFKAATVPAAGCMLSTRECDPVTEWWYFRVPASQPDWAEQASE